LFNISVGVNGECR